MKYLAVKNKKLIKRVYKDELKRLLYKSIYYNTSLPTNVRFKAYIKMLSFIKQSSVSYLKPRCLWTHNSRAVITFCKVSRFKFRMLAAYGSIPGIRKASW